MHLLTGIFTVYLVGVSLCHASLPAVPTHQPYPHAPANFQIPHQGARSSQVCTVPSDVDDAGPAILAAANECNNGGTVYFPPGETFTIATALDLTFLASVDFAILGTIYFSDDISIWPDQAFKYPFQNTSVFWRFGGEDVRIYGDGQGVIDG
jgi:galacturan 1,4-alpha-galacturonidase